MTSSLFAYYEQNSFLHRRNPAIKLGLAFLYILVATFLFDLQTLTLLTLLVLFVVWRLGRVHLPLLLRGLLPFLVLGLGYLWMNALFPRTQGEAITILFRFGPFQVIKEGVITGIALTARALCFGACSLFFVSTTDPTDFIMSLIQQLRLSPRLAYGALAAYRFVPLLEVELAQIRAAHHLRGLGEGEGVRGKVLQLYRYTLPLLASALRKAGRVAIAMEARAFTGDRDRTYYRVVRIEQTDWLLVIGGVLMLIAILAGSWQAGWLQLWRGGLGF